MATSAATPVAPHEVRLHARRRLGRELAVGVRAQQVGQHLVLALARRTALRGVAGRRRRRPSGGVGHGRRSGRGVGGGAARGAGRAGGAGGVRGAPVGHGGHRYGLVEPGPPVERHGAGEQPPPARDAAHHRADRHAEHVGDLLVAQPVDVVQLDGRGEVLGHHGQCRPHHRRVEPRRHLGEHRVGVGVGGRRAATRARPRAG
jgi:hypothetical protein